MSKALAVLEGARELIADECNWIKDDNWMNIDGRDCFCSLGAIDAAAQRLGVNTTPACSLLYDLLIDRGQRATISGFNDNPDTTHADVLALFDRAIEKARVGG